ncbi:MAG: TlpA disulfide reductase family protein [Polyangiaceae bacterium]
MAQQAGQTKAVDEEKPVSNFVVGLLAAAILLVIALLPKLTIGQHPMVAKTAPDFTLDVVMNGAPEQTKLTLSELRGHPVLLDFWASWCGPCQMQAPILERISRRYRDKGLVVLGVNTSDKPGRAVPSAQRKGLTYPILFDAANEANDLYNVESLPMLVLVGKDGSVKMVRTGVVDEGSLDALVTGELLLLLIP